MSTIKVNKIEKRTGSTLTLGGACTAVTLACGATQTGFGRTGTVDWCTTAKTSPFTAANGVGYFINTAGGAVTVTLPSSPSGGDIISIKDYGRTFDCNAVTLCRNGSKIASKCFNASLGTDGQSVTLIFVDATQGWLNVQTDSTVVGNEFVSATGGFATITCGNFKTHIFTGDGTFCVSSAGLPSGSTSIDYFVVGGGGAGGTSAGPAGGMGGGGGGGFRLSNSPVNGIPAPTMSPLVAPNSPTPGALTASVGSFPITVGGGGTVTPNSGSPFVSTNGGNSTFSTITSAGGGFGGGGPGSPPAPTIGGPGGSGGGGQYNGPYPKSTGVGNTPPTTPAQGNPGGAVTAASDPPGSYGGSGGGGAACAGAGGDVGPGGLAGGAGSFLADAVIGPTAPSYGTSGPVSSVRYFAGGGGGGNRIPQGPSAANGGTGGGGGGAKSPYPAPGSVFGTDGTINTGGGGGGGTYDKGGAGGSGIVILRYKFQS
jgi:hypothetical protein